MKKKNRPTFITGSMTSRHLIAGGRYWMRCLSDGAKKGDAATPPPSTLPKPADKIRVDRPIFIAAHVGSGFCRVAAICSQGKVLRWVEVQYSLHQSGVFMETSSEIVWNIIVKCIKKITERIEKGEVHGIGFTALPALVCLDKLGQPITASASREPKLNVILHYDKRSTLEAMKINATRHSHLRYFGEQVLPDLQETKLLWLKNNLQEDCWNRAGHFMDLTDYMTWKATGSFIRSSSTLNTQWTYEIGVNNQEGWNSQFFKEIELEELAEDNFKKIGTQIQRPGAPLAEGLLASAAEPMGLKTGLPVPTGMSDGLAGCLGLVGCNFKGVADDFTNRLCVIFGMRAAAHFIMSREPRFVKGVNGPFKDSVLPGLWMNQAGQTAAESALDYIIDSHPASKEVKKQITEMNIHKYLNKILKLKAHKKKLNARSYLTKNLHVLPDFEGNKSPLADPWIRGMVSGVSTSTGQESLALQYLATMQSLAYGTKHIISTMTAQGHDIRCILLGGGLGKNSLFSGLNKDICQIPTVSPDEAKSKLLGGAILAAVASNIYKDFNNAMEEMCGSGHVSLPDTDDELIGYHDKKFQVFLKMYDHQMEYRRIMSGGNEHTKKVNVNKQ